VGELTCAAFHRAYGITTRRSGRRRLQRRDVRARPRGRASPTTGVVGRSVPVGAQGRRRAGIGKALEASDLPGFGAYTLGAADTRCPSDDGDLEAAQAGSRPGRDPSARRTRAAPCPSKRPARRSATSRVPTRGRVDGPRAAGSDSTPIDGLVQRGAVRYGLASMRRTRHVGAMASGWSRLALGRCSGRQGSGRKRWWPRTQTDAGRPIRERMREARGESAPFSNVDGSSSFRTATKKVAGSRARGVYSAAASAAAPRRRSFAGGDRA